MRARVLDPGVHVFDPGASSEDVRCRAMAGGSQTQNQAYLAIHGHFYQPPREDPFTGRQPREPGAAPYLNFNEKIADECYRPNAELGNFERISFDLGPTLASWLERH